MNKLIPTIIQDYKSEAVYMLGYSNDKSLKITKLVINKHKPVIYKCEIIRSN